MLQVQFKNKPANRAELRTALDIRCAEMGISRSTFAVNQLGIAPYILMAMLDGRTGYRAHPETAQKVCDITGAPLSAWEIAGV